jgi:hypothetical protein
LSFNTREGIAAELGSYKSFYEVLLARHNYRENHMSALLPSRLDELNEFVVLGRYFASSLGQCMRLSRSLFTDEDRKQMPPVMTSEEFDRYVESHVRPRTKQDLNLFEPVQGIAPAFPLPPPHLLCEVCSNGFTDLENCHDIDTLGDDQELDLTPLAGKTLRQAEDELALRTDAVREQTRPLAVYKSSWASTDPNMTRTEREGWRFEHSVDHPISWDYEIGAGDRVVVFRYRYFHGECFRKQNQKLEHVQEQSNVETLREMFESAGFEDVQLTQAALPAHMLDWIAEDCEEDEDERELAAQELGYYRVETKQGAFGVGMAAYPFLDLHGTGASLTELFEEYTHEIPKDAVAIVPLTGEPQQLLRLWQLMTKKQAQA